MASWALVLGYSGYRYDAQKRALGFAPRSRAGDFRCFFSTGTAWGDFSRHGGGAELKVRYGSLPLSRLDVQLPEGSPVREAAVNGRQVSMQVDSSNRETSLSFDTLALT